MMAHEFQTSTDLETWITLSDTETKINFLVRHAAEQDKANSLRRLQVDERLKLNEDRLERQRTRVKELEDSDKKTVALATRQSIIISGIISGVIAGAGLLIRVVWG